MLSTIATPADAEAIADLVNAAYRGSGSRHGWTHEAELLSGARISSSDVAAMIDDTRTTVLVWRPEPSSAPGGCVAIDMEDGDHCTISMLAVAPERQTANVGRALLTDAGRVAARLGARGARITVVEQRDALLAWYERRGYRRTGQIEAFPYGDNSVGTPLRDDLQFAVLTKSL